MSHWPSYHINTPPSRRVFVPNTNQTAKKMKTLNHHYHNAGDTNKRLMTSDLVAQAQTRARFGLKWRAERDSNQAGPSPITACTLPTRC